MKVKQVKQIRNYKSKKTLDHQTLSLNSNNWNLTQFLGEPMVQKNQPLSSKCYFSFILFKWLFIFQEQIFISIWQFVEHLWCYCLATSSSFSHLLGFGIYTCWKNKCLYANQYRTLIIFKTNSLSVQGHSYDYFELATLAARVLVAEASNIFSSQVSWIWCFANGGICNCSAHFTLWIYRKFKGC